MKTQYTRNKETYQAPTAIVVEVAVEQGFAATAGANPWNPGGGF